MNCPEALAADLALVRNIEARLVRGRAAVLRQLNRAYSGLHIGANEATVLVAIQEGVSTTPTGLSNSDFIAESPPWAAHYAACKAFAASVAGGHVDVVETTQLGMHGNSHMLMQDRNNLKIADVVTDWTKHKVH